MSHGKVMRRRKKSIVEKWDYSRREVKRRERVAKKREWSEKERGK